MRSPTGFLTDKTAYCANTTRCFVPRTEASLTISRRENRYDYAFFIFLREHLLSSFRLKYERDVNHVPCHPRNARTITPCEINSAENQSAHEYGRNNHAKRIVTHLAIDINIWTRCGTYFRTTRTFPQLRSLGYPKS